MNIEMFATKDLIPYAHNVNTHTEEQIDQIVESIKEFGFLDPVGVWPNPDGALEIVEGHGRVLAARKIGLDKIPVIKLDGLKDSQRRSYAILHNQLTRNSEFDLDKLNAEIGDLGDFDFDFDWSDFGIDLIGGADNPADDKDDDFDFDEPGQDHDKRYIICPKCGFEWAV